MDRLAVSVLLEPVGDLTPEISRRLCAAAEVAAAHDRQVVISLRSIARVSWAGLCRLADGLGGSQCPPGPRFRDVAPSVRALLETVGLGDLIEERRLLGV